MLILVFLVFVCPNVTGFDFTNLESRISDFTLKNGLKFIIVEDHSIPIAHFATYANVGGGDERKGKRGIAHFLEHMVFKGTREIGTTNYKREQELMKKMDRLSENLMKEKKNREPDTHKIKKMEEELEKLQVETSKYIVSNEYNLYFKRHGAVELSAGTSKDFTLYYTSVPGNKIELWAYLESSRLMNPVFREFFKEKEVIKEERLLRVDNSPTGKLVEKILAEAFPESHPYRDTGIGSMKEIEHMSRRDIKDFFKSHYTANNLTIGIMGDVYPDQIKKLANRYFSSLKAGKKKSIVKTEFERKHKEKFIYENSQPWLVIGYYCPSFLNVDFNKFMLLDYILTSGRSSRLYNKMVTRDKSAMLVASGAGFPGNKYTSLYLIYALANKGHSNNELEKQIFKEIENIKQFSITEDELKSARIRYKADLFKDMKSKKNLLMRLIKNDVLKGSWKKMFDTFEEIEKISADDIKHLVNTYLGFDNCIIIRVEKKKEVKK
jgi:predicted Zn-dependent peptidase